MDAIISCESGYNPTAQSNHAYTKDRPLEGVVAGQREQSFGLVQIHLPAHKNISYEQAIDPVFAVEFLAKNIKNGNIWMWSCARQLAMI